ncbi:MAG: ribonuclease P protein component [Candidatus Nanopelagicales bacterium]
MLPREHRLHRAEDFSTTVKRGRQAGRRTLVGHLLVPPTARALEPESAPPRIGFVVSRAVGNAVTRHRVTRRLRHVAQSRAPRLPAGSLLVLRALTPAGSATSADLAADLDAALDRLLPPHVTP